MKHANSLMELQCNTSRLHLNSRVQAFMGCITWDSTQLYSPLASGNVLGASQPIYVGKAVPRGWRTGRAATLISTVLWSRLNQHARSIDATDLRSEDFLCRFIILTGIEIDLVVPVEAELIRRYTPLWNTVVDGFGNHDPGKGRYNQAVSEWDTLHPGRNWVRKLMGERPDRDNIIAQVKNHLERR